MRKLLLLFAFVSICSSAIAQEFPYGKMLKMTDQEFKESKFKYNSKYNNWTLSKSNGWNSTVNVMSALNGQSADVKPHPDDYTVVVQKGEEGIASISVVFHKDDTYHDLLTFATDNGIDLLETNSGNLNKIQFAYQGYSFVLELKRIGQTSTTSNTRAFVSSRDNSYNIYTFTILTGINPVSPYLIREAERIAIDEAKGRKKRTVEELM